MKIRNAELNDLPTILQIYDDAKKYMRAHGNLEQWNNGYPNEEVILKDISDKTLYLVYDTDYNDIIGVFAYIQGPDITYNEIFYGNWPNSEPYYVIHRIAVTKHRKGVASFIFEECLKNFPRLRIDTHKDNIPMQNSLIKNGFTYCGIIHLLSGDERLAYQKERILNAYTTSSN